MSYEKRYVEAQSQHGQYHDYCYDDFNVFVLSIVCVACVCVQCRSRRFKNCTCSVVCVVLYLCVRVGVSTYACKYTRIETLNLLWCGADLFVVAIEFSAKSDHAVARVSVVYPVAHTLCRRHREARGVAVMLTTVGATRVCRRMVCDTRKKKESKVPHTPHARVRINHDVACLFSLYILRVCMLCIECV